MNDVIETRGNLRAVLHYDEGADAPDGDYFGYVFRLDRWGCELMGKAYSAPAEDFGIPAAWERFRDMALVERYLRIYCAVVGFDYFDTQDAKYVNVVTVDDLKLWGFDSAEDYRTRTGHDDPSYDNLTEWRAWVDGEAYYYTIEGAVTWARMGDVAFPHDEPETMTTWEELDQCGGYFGREDAEQAARDALLSYEIHDNQ